MYIALLFVYFFASLINFELAYFQNFFGNLLLAELFFHPYCQKYWLGKVVDSFALVLFAKKYTVQVCCFVKKVYVN